MTNKELNETLALIARSPESFRRDTPLIFRQLDKLQEVERRLQKAIYGDKPKTIVQECVERNLPTDYCPHCCVVHVTCECPREGETEKQYWQRMAKRS